LLPLRQVRAVHPDPEQRSASVAELGGVEAMPLYPAATHGAHPLCTHVPTLRLAEAEGFAAVDRIVQVRMRACVVVVGGG
jgi:hypothetical protein